MKLESAIKKNWKTVLAILAIVVILSSAGTSINLSTLNVNYPLPSYEGLHFIFIGVQPAGSSILYTANSNQTEICPLANCPFIQSVTSNGQFATGSYTTYSWNYNQVGASLQLCEIYVGCDTIAITPTTTAPQQISTLSYSVSSGTGSYQVNGQVMQNSMQLDLAVQSGSSANVQFKGDTLWFAIYSQGYNNIYPSGQALPNGTLTSTWASPLFNEFTGAPTPSGQAGTQANNYATTPGTSTTTQTLPLYPIPQTTSNFISLVGSQGGGQSTPSITGLASTLSSGNILAPDNRMQEFAFFNVVLNNFGAYGCAYISTCTNNLLLNFQVNTLQLGTYAYTNPITSSQTTQNYNCQGATCGIANWFSNPWNLFGLGSFGIIIIAVIVFVGLIALTGRIPRIRK